MAPFPFRKHLPIQSVELIFRHAPHGPAGHTPSNNIDQPLYAAVPGGVHFLEISWRLRYEPHQTTAAAILVLDDFT